MSFYYFMFSDLSTAYNDYIKLCTDENNSTLKIIHNQ